MGDMAVSSKVMHFNYIFITLIKKWLRLKLLILTMWPSSKNLNLMYR